MATSLGKKVACSQGKLRHFWGFSWSESVKVLKIRLWSAEYLENVDEIFLINKIILITLNIPSSVWKEEACLLNEENIFPGNLWPSLPSSPNVRTEKAEVGWEESETQTLLTVTSWPRPEAIRPEIGVNWMLSNAFLTTFFKVEMS